jgi:hypothetical protein
MDAGTTLSVAAVQDARKGALLSLTLANSEQAYWPRGMRNIGSLSTIS